MKPKTISHLEQVIAMAEKQNEILKKRLKHLESVIKQLKEEKEKLVDN